MQELQERAAKLLHDARAILDTASTEQRSPTTEELAKHETIMADFDRVQAQLRAEARTADAEQAVRSIGPKAGRETGQAGPSPDEYRDSFWQAMRTGAFSPELRALSYGADTAGGYAVPDAFRRELIQALNEENVIRQYATVFTTTSGILSIPTISAHGSASWKTEAAAYAESDETFGEVQLSAYKATCLIKVSEELLADSAFPLESYLATEFGRRIGRLEETAFTTGSGSNQPTGVVGGSTLGVTAAATNAVTADELVDLYHSLGRAYRNRAVWLMADSTVKAIRKLVTGVSGDKTYLWSPGLGAGEPDTLLGRPVVVSQDVVALAASAKTIIFGDLSYYYIGDRQMISMQRLNELYAGNGQIGFRMFKRTDGKLALATAAYHLIMHS